jgi:hypothetical protein
MADILNPTVPGATVSPFPPELQLQAQQIARRRAITDMLLMRGMTPPAHPTGYNGQPVPMSPLAGLAPLLSGILAARGSSSADQASTELSQKYSTGLAAARAAMLERIKAGDLAGANAVAGPWPALSHLADAAAMQTLPKREVTEVFDKDLGRPRKEVVDVNNPAAPTVPLGGVKEPSFQKVETMDANGLPTTTFVDPSVAAGQPPMPAPNPNMAVPLGGTTNLVPRYGPPGVLPHTIDPNRVPTNEDIEAAAQRIAEYRAPGYATAGGRAQPWQMQVMRRADEILKSRGQPAYDSSVFPVVQAAEKEFNQKNAPIVRSFGTLVGHVTAAKELFKALDNPSDVQKLNQARNFFLEEFGVAAPTNVAVAKQFIADEAVKAVLSAPGALDDRKSMAEHLSRSGSSAQFNTDADTVIHFGVENMKNHLQQLKGMTKGKRAEEDFIQYLSPNAREAFFKYGGSDRRKGPQEGLAVPPSASRGGVTLPSASDIDAELARRKAAGG